MKKRFNDKLALTKETLRTLTGLDVIDAKGGVSALCTTLTSTPTDTCETCVGPSCRPGGGTATSSCC
jgi:hypothetical protein